LKGYQERIRKMADIIKIEPCESCEIGRVYFGKYPVTVYPEDMLTELEINQNFVVLGACDTCGMCCESYQTGI
jgi:hypothetical protein